jgi:hypothetical protein
MMRTPEYERELARRLTVYQADFDSALEPFGRSAPAPPLGVGANEYRRTALAYMTMFTAPDNRWRNAKLDSLKSAVLDIAQSEIIDGMRAVAQSPRLMAETPAARPDSTNPNIKAVPVSRGGAKTMEFYGESFVKSMGRPGRRVIGFMNNPALMPQR